AGSLIINEFVSDPVSGADEWVEIYNPSNETFILAEWTIREGSGAVTALPDTYLATGQYVIVGPISGKLNNRGDAIELIDPDGTVIDLVSYGEGTDVPAVADPDAVALDASGLWQATTMPTPGEANVISDEVVEEEVVENVEDVEIVEVEDVVEEEVVVEDAPPADDVAGSRQADDGGIEIVEETPIVIETPIIITSYDLRLSEIYPNTSGEDSTEEFIELVNSGSVVADLLNWSVTDASGKTWTASESSEVQPGALVTLSRDTTKIALNNSGSEAVSLIAPNGATVDELTYDKTTKGYSLILLNGTWLWTSTPTPNEPNVFSEAASVAEVASSPVAIEEEVADTTAAPAASETSSSVAPSPPSTSSKATSTKKTTSVTKTSLAAVRDLALNTKVQVSGTVSAPPGLFGRQVMYLAGSGIQVYMYSADWPELELGDVVELTGELTSSRGETRIKISTASDVTLIDHIAEPAAHEIEIEEVGEEVEGWLVSVSGVIQSIESDRLSLESDGTTVLVIAKEATEMDLYELNEGMRIEVTGVVSQYYDSYRILPRSMNDIEILEAEPTSPAGLSAKDQAGGMRSLYAIAITVLSVVVLSFLAFRYLRNKRVPEFTARAIDYSAA
ncbi:MAG: lamin tail domain-containing protein, partial [Candidatus Uhrbacteria bacterium]